MTDVGIIGVGAIALSLADDLMSSGVTPLMISRNDFSGHCTIEDRRCAADTKVETRTWQLDTSTYSQAFDIKAVSVDASERSLSRCCIVFVAVKASGLEDALERLAASRFSGAVIMLQNGLTPLELARRFSGELDCWLLLTRQAAIRVKHGSIVRTGTGESELGHVPVQASAQLLETQTSKAQEILNLLNNCGWKTHFNPDISKAVWQKLAINVAINGMTALLLIPNGGLTQSESASALADECVGELVRIAARQGIFLTESDLCLKWREVASMTAQNASSTLQDVLAQRVSEISSMNGSIAKLAQQYKIPAPVNDLIARLIRAREETYDSQQPFIELRLSAAKPPDG